MEDKKKFIINTLEYRIPIYYYNGIKRELLKGNYLQAINYTYDLKLMQTLIDDYGYDLVVECMIEVFATEE